MFLNWTFTGALNGAFMLIYQHWSRSIKTNKKKMTSRNPSTLLSIPNDDTFDFLFKVVLIGDCGTGKTCVVQRFKTGNYEERHGNTIGVDFSMKTISIDNKKVKIQIWDTGTFLIDWAHHSSIKLEINVFLCYCKIAGQERFRTITQSYYRSANGVIIGKCYTY